jgi:hypothetical protein
VIQPNCTASWVQRTVTGTDAYGNDLYGETTVSVGAVFAPGSSSELIQGQDTVLTHPSLYLPLSSPPAPTDRVVVDGVTYDVDGKPEVWPASPLTGWQPDYPVVVRLLNVTG